MEEVNIASSWCIFGFHQVWLADWEDRRVAVKRLSRIMSMADEETMHEFLAETKFMRSIRHPNIVFFYGAGILDNLPFLVTGLQSKSSQHDHEHLNQNISLAGR